MEITCEAGVLPSAPKRTSMCLLTGATYLETMDWKISCETEINKQSESNIDYITCDEGPATIDGSASVSLTLPVTGLIKGQ